MKNRHRFLRVSGAWPILVAIALLLPGCGPGSEPTSPRTAEPAAQAVIETTAVELTDEQVENLVRRSYPYVAMYNVNNKFALTAGGWNTVDVNTELKDHTMQDIARPNNDSLYIGIMLDLTRDPMIIEMPAFDSNYVSLMITAYDHYVNIPMSTGAGDFHQPEKMLLYTARTQG
jgi:hypothetical protein